MPNHLSSSFTLSGAATQESLIQKTHNYSFHDHHRRITLRVVFLGGCSTAFCRSRKTRGTLLTGGERSEGEGMSESQDYYVHREAHEQRSHRAIDPNRFKRGEGRHLRSADCGGATTQENGTEALVFLVNASLVSFSMTPPYLRKPHSGFRLRSRFRAQVLFFASPVLVLASSISSGVSFFNQTNVDLQTSRFAIFASSVTLYAPSSTLLQISRFIFFASLTDWGLFYFSCFSSHFVIYD